MTQEYLRDEITKACNENWDVKTFWINILRLMDRKDMQSPYLVKPNGEKVYTDQDKLKLYHEIWSNIFKISPRRK